uniref:somatostatin receptor type 5-like n=1 Tax=Styela clava TaxID=7725 RepID=UPI001939A55C|nr:somatostatin receptor type 5-like [Styela clava]
MAETLVDSKPIELNISTSYELATTYPGYNHTNGNDEYTLDPNIQAINGFRIFVCAVGVLGNIIVIAMILLLTEFNKGVTHWYILQLAIADSAFLLTLPFQVVEDANNEWIFSDGMCKAKEAVLFVNYYSSISFLTVMALDRYIAVCHAFSDRLQKLRTTKAAYIITAIVWTVAILICIPIMMYSTKRGREPFCKCELQFPEYGFDMEAHNICSEDYDPDDDSGSGYGYDECMKDMTNTEKSPACSSPDDNVDYPGETLSESDELVETPNPECQYDKYNQGFIGFLYFNFIVMFIVPFMIIAACYILIIVHLHKKRFRGDALSRKTKDDKDTVRVVIMCAILVIVFAVCWLPYHSVQMAKMKGISGTSDFCSKLFHAASLVAYLNSAINPYIYFIAARFKTQLRLMKNSKPFSVIMSFLSKTTKADSSNNKSPRRTIVKDENEIEDQVQEDTGL